MRILTTLLLLAPLSAFAGAKDKAIENAMEKIWEQGDFSVIDEAYEEEIGNEVKRFVKQNRDLYPDLEIEIVDSIIKGNRFVTVWKATGTHIGLKKKVVLEGVSVRTREGGKFTQERMFFDTKRIYDQLGFEITPPEGLSPFTTAMVERGEEAPEEPADDAEMESGEGDEKMEEGAEEEAPAEDGEAE
jgi:hypothetical protein